MDKTKMKKTETFASIFGDDYEETEKKSGAPIMEVNDLMKWWKVSRTMV